MIAIYSVYYEKADYCNLIAILNHNGLGLWACLGQEGVQETNALSILQRFALGYQNRPVLSMYVVKAPLPSILKQIAGLTSWKDRG
jgi:hypothetical protein